MDLVWPEAPKEQSETPSPTFLEQFSNFPFFPISRRFPWVLDGMVNPFPIPAISHSHFLWDPSPKDLADFFHCPLSLSGF